MVVWSNNGTFCVYFCQLMKLCVVNALKCVIFFIDFRQMFGCSRSTVSSELNVKCYLHLLPCLSL